MHSVTDRQTDRRHDDANSRSYCVAVRSAKNCPVTCSLYRTIHFVKSFVLLEDTVVMLVIFVI